MSTLEDDFEFRLPAEELRQIRDKAAENAKALGLSDVEWQQVRRRQGRLLADILMACDPQLPLERPADGPKAASRPLGNLRIDELVSELREARLAGDTARLRVLLDETRYRKSKLAVRLGARVRLSLFALEKPDALPNFLK